MILSFRSWETEKIWNEERVKSIPPDIQQIGSRKLRMFNNSQNMADLRIPASSRLVKLSGTMHDYYSILINDQWWIIFKWKDGNTPEVTIMDYHK
jgi:proteic killer suppression protein